MGTLQEARHHDGVCGRPRHGDDDTAPITALAARSVSTTATVALAAATTRTTTTATTTTARTVLPRRVRSNANTTAVGWLTAGPIAVAVAAPSSRTRRGCATVGAGALTARFIIMSVIGDGSRTGSNANPTHVRIDGRECG